MIVEPFGYANGLALSEDEQHLFMVESDTDSIHRVDLKLGSVEVYAEAVGRMRDRVSAGCRGLLICVLLRKRRHSQDRCRG